jgi:fructose-bisphosphate aldolase class II
MIVSQKKILKIARKKKFGVGAYNTSNLEITQAILSASVKSKAPVIIATSEKAIDYFGGEDNAATLINALSKKVNIPVSLHLDHSKSFERVKECISAGYGSVMIDASRLSFKDNIALTKKVVTYAHKRGVQVEGELGTIGGKEDYVKGGKLILAEPKDATVFVKRTGIDSLAAAVGTAHGTAAAVTIKEKIDFPRLIAISKVVSIPLVLHGASEGIPDKDIRKAITFGIAKINIDTNLRVAFTKDVRLFLIKNKKAYDPRAIITAGRDAIEKTVTKKIKLFNTQNKSRIV